MSKFTNYEVYFEIGGKKMRTTVMAESEEKAKTRVKEKIKFHKITYKRDFVDDQAKDLFSALGIKHDFDSQ